MYHEMYGGAFYFGDHNVLFADYRKCDVPEGRGGIRQQGELAVLFGKALCLLQVPLVLRKAAGDVVFKEYFGELKAGRVVVEFLLGKLGDFQGYAVS